MDLTLFSAYYLSLSLSRTQVKIRARLDRVEDGNLGDCKSVGEGVFELKIDYGPGYRLYFGEEGITIIILLCGGDKSTQKQDIDKAQEYWKDYRSRDNA
ncbi:type II toxin-antitoxin system RelE/ParE family toxin [Nostoc sp. XA013]|nr:type II toxin-antitoxin system RelE/ParE family toxin [Nostoc sp. XA013]